MINIEFTQQQVEELKIYYNYELDKIQKRAYEIKEILDKFNGHTKAESIQVEKIVVPNSIIKTKENNIDNKVDNSEDESWATTIIKAMEQIGKPTYKEEIYNMVAKIRGIELTGNIFHTIDQAIFSLRRVHKKIVSIGKSGRKKIYQLTGTPDKSTIQITPKIKIEKNIKPQNIDIDKQSRSDLILDILQKKNKPMTIREIVDTIKTQLNLPKTVLQRTYNNVGQNLFKLRTIEKKVQSIRKGGVNTKLYGLTEWNNKQKKQNKILQKEKQNKITKTTVELANKITPKRIQSKELPVIPYKEWTDLITGLLNKEQKLLHIKDFLPIAIKYYNVTDNRKIEIRNRLSPILTRLVKDGKTKTIKKDKIKGRSYGLPEWFNANGELKSEYAKSNAQQGEIIKKGTNKNNRTEWPIFILNTIKEHNKVLQANQLVDIAMSKFKIPIVKKGSIRASVSSTISNLEKNRKTIKSTSIEGERGKHFGLSEWFFENGKIKTEYKPEIKELNTNIEKQIKQKKEKSIWPAFVLNTLREENKILQAKYLVDLAMNQFKIANDEYEHVRLLLASTISSFIHDKGKIKPIKLKGEKANHYGLSEWFNEKGELKIEYTKTDV